VKRGSKLKIQPSEAWWILDHIEIYDLPSSGKVANYAHKEIAFYMALAMYNKPLNLRYEYAVGDEGCCYAKEPSTGHLVYGLATKKGNLRV
jgi:hypothetical protein